MWLFLESNHFGSNFGNYGRTINFPNSQETCERHVALTTLSMIFSVTNYLESCNANLIIMYLIVYQ